MVSKQPTPPPVIKEDKEYQNNPFFVATDGFSLLFKYAKSVAIFLLVVSAVLAIMQIGSPSDNTFMQPGNTESQSAQMQSFESFANSIDASKIAGIITAVVVISLAIIVASIMLSGISAYTAAQVSQGKTTTLKQAFNAVLSRFGSYAWLLILIGVKTFLWTLLFIIPGIIMSVRYSLAGAVFFDDRTALKGNNAIKKSSELVKGSWLTTFASQTLLNVITLGWISFFISASTQAKLYKQYVHVSASNTPKPRAHWLTWVTVFLPLAIFFVIIVLALLAFSYFAQNGFSE